MVKEELITLTIVSTRYGKIKKKCPHLLPGKDNIAKEWQWLLSYSCAVKSTNSLLRRQAFPQTFKLLNKEKFDTDSEVNPYVSFLIPPFT